MKGGKSKSGAKQTHRMLNCSAKAAKKSNRPKCPQKPPSDYFIFVNEFSKQFMEKRTDNKSMESKVSDLFRAAKVQWETMSDADKAPYVEEAEKRMAEYSKSLNEYRQNLFAYQKKKDAIKEKSEEAAEEVSTDLTELIIRQ